MEISPNPGKKLRSKIGRIATAIAVAFVICSVAVGPTRAADDRGHDDRGADRHHDNPDRGERGPDFYYAPAPNYYYAPEPQYDPPPAEGINLFFGVR